MNYEEALEYIHKVNWRGSKRGLSRTQDLLDVVGNPHKKLKFVHVAGTNGKGSTSACIESILREAGYKTGLYTSPYITRFNERIRVNGEEIGDDELAELVTEMEPIAESLPDKPTEFEVITVLGMMYFARKNCDVVVLEVGLGGEFDSTNVIDTPEAAVITAMGLDHTAILGPTIKDVAIAKAGIIKPDGDVIIYGGVPEADAVFADRCREQGARLHVTDFSSLNVTEYGLTHNRFDFGKYKDIYLSLGGTYQPKNAALAVTAVEVLREKGWKVSDEDIINGLARVSWPGRFEVIGKDPLFILDGAHNPHGMTAAAESIKKLLPGKKIVFLTGVMADKDVSNMFPLLAPFAKCFITVRPDNSRSLDAGEYAELLRSSGLEAEACGSIYEGVEKACKKAGKKGVVCALGSLYFSADVRAAANKYYDKK